MRIATVICLSILAGGDALSQSLSTAGERTAALVQVQHVETIGDSASEPTIVEHPDGTLFASGYGKLAGGQPQQTPRLWKSTDHGGSWAPVTLGSAAEDATANSDVSLAVAPNGTLYLVQLEFDPKAATGLQVVVGASGDVGATWRWTALSKEHLDDRPWVAVAPDGTAHVIWSDAGGVHHTASRDDGKTWSAPQRIYATGGSSHLAVGPHGEVAVRITPAFAAGSRFTAGADYIAISIDGGSTWQNRAPPGDRDWAPSFTVGALPRWVEPLAWDSKGALYSLWTNIKGVWLAQSIDRGATWHQWRIADIDALSYYPYLAAQGHGQLAATWFSGAGETLQWHLARIQVGSGQAKPLVAQLSGLRTDSWVTGAEGDAAVRDTLGEYLTVLFLRNGDLAVVSPIQNPETKRLGFSFWQFREH